MTRVHNKKVNKIPECNLLHDIINSSKRTKHLNSHYYPILHACMNTRHGRAKFKSFWILLDSGFSPTILMVRLVEKIHHEKDAVMQRHIQARNITTNHKVKVFFTLTTPSTMNFVTWKCHVDDSAKSRYNMI